MLLRFLVLAVNEIHIDDIAVKAVTAAQLSMASLGVYSVTLDEAIEAMRLTAADMSVKYKETSLSVCIWLLSIFMAVNLRCDSGTCCERQAWMYLHIVH